jgi:hypothetical protein
VFCQPRFSVLMPSPSAVFSQLRSSNHSSFPSWFLNVYLNILVFAILRKHKSQTNQPTTKSRKKPPRSLTILTPLAAFISRNWPWLRCLGNITIRLATTNTTRRTLRNELISLHCFIHH